MLECELSRAPIDKVEWLKDGKPLGRPSKRMVVEQDNKGTVHRITFTSVTDEDLGVYTIRVEKLTSESRLEMKGMSVRCMHYRYSLSYTSLYLIQVSDAFWQSTLAVLLEVPLHLLYVPVQSHSVHC